VKYIHHTLLTLLIPVLLCALIYVGFVFVGGALALALMFI
jgi:hypothetical protein